MNEKIEQLVRFIVDLVLERLDARDAARPRCNAHCGLVQPTPSSWDMFEAMRCVLHAGHPSGHQNAAGDYWSDHDWRR